MHSQRFAWLFASERTGEYATNPCDNDDALGARTRGRTVADQPFAYGHDAAHGGGDHHLSRVALRDATERLERAARDVVTILATHLHDVPTTGQEAVTSDASLDGQPATEPSDTSPTGHGDPVEAPTSTALFEGELAALEQVLVSMNLVQSATVDLVGHVQRNKIAVRRVGMTLTNYLAGFARITLYERRRYLSTSHDLHDMPHLHRAFRRGHVGFGEVRAVIASAQRLAADDRARIDAAFADAGRLASTAADELVDQTRRMVDTLDPKHAEEQELRQIERRFLAITPQLDGALTLYGELDAEAGATFLSALDAAMPPPSALNDHSRNALDSNGGVTAPWSARGRQRADALVRLAEHFAGGPASLAGGPTGGHRAKPRIQVIADIATLAGGSGPARLLWDAFAPKVTLTATAARRVASDASLQFVLTDSGEVLGISAPTTAIPTKVRAAVRARDQGCRFPGCHAPFRWCDLHHVIPREHKGPTLVENLVALCRRHHTAVTQSTWSLTMDPSGAVTVRRGRRTASSRPPLPWPVPPGSTALSRQGRPTSPSPTRADRLPGPGDVPHDDDVPC